MQSSYSTDFGAAFQKHVLAVMCTVPGFCIRYRSALDHTYFADKAHRVIAKSVLQVVDQDGRLPALSTLTEVVRENVGSEDFEHVELAVQRLFEEDVHDATVVVHKVVDFGKQQALVNAVLQAAERLDKGDRKIKGLIDKALTVGEDLLSVGVRYKEAVADRRSWYTDPEQAIGGLRTGIVHLDVVLDSGLARGELGVILAPPGRGKSTMLVNIGFGALTSVAGLRVAHYSLEMNFKRVVRRYDDRVMGKRVKYKRSDPERYVDELIERMKLLAGELYVHSYSTRSVGVSAIRSNLSLLASRGFRPDVIIVDYADILRAERRLGEMRHEQAGIYEDLRQLAGDFDAAVWTGSQASKGALEKEVITIGDFSESFEKAAIVDVALAMCQMDDEKIDNRARLFAAKVRNAEDGRTVECELRRDCCLIRSVGILDAAGTRIVGDIDERFATKTTYVSSKKTVEQIKSDVGLKKKKAFKPKKRTIGMKPASTKKKLRDVPRRDLSAS